MSVAARSTTSDRFGVKARISMLAPPLAALLYPFALEAFNASVTRIGKAARASPLSTR
jgi:hypothetical protein